MFPDQFIGIAVGRVGRKIEQPQPAVQALDKCFGLFGDMGRASIDDQEKVTVTYENIFKLMRDVRLMGEGNAVAARDKSFPGKALFMEAARLYAERSAAPDGRLE